MNPILLVHNGVAFHPSALNNNDELKNYNQKIIKNLSYCTTVKLQNQHDNAKPKITTKAAPFSRSGGKAGYVG